MRTLLVGAAVFDLCCSHPRNRLATELACCFAPHVKDDVLLAAGASHPLAARCRRSNLNRITPEMVSGLSSRPCLPFVKLSRITVRTVTLPRTPCGACTKHMCSVHKSRLCTCLFAPAVHRQRIRGCLASENPTHSLHTCSMQYLCRCLPPLPPHTRAYPPPPSALHTGHLAEARECREAAAPTRIQQQSRSFNALCSPHLHHKACGESEPHLLAAAWQDGRGRLGGDTFESCGGGRLPRTSGYHLSPPAD